MSVDFAFLAVFAVAFACKCTLLILNYLVEFIAILDSI